ncbi:unnamed protein product [Rotaria sp. Silwood1]|nr:unnamed protein product [Rotaria sp. Silwood1]CAF4532681.1 unnamed protein product [Rotaria sp. Silwood1]
MATTSSAPILYSILTSSHDNNEDFVNQLRNHLNQIETNVQETLNKIQQRKPYTSTKTTTNKIDSTIRNNFLNILKDVAMKNNTPFDELLFRQQILDKQNSSPSLKVDVVRAKSSIINDTNDQHLSPINNTRRSQFAPVLSSTPVHQTSPITPIPVDLTMATPSVPPVLLLKSTDLPTALPSAIVPQRAKVGRTAAAGRPPRIPRGESVTRQKKTSPLSVKEQQQEEIILSKEIYLSSKRQIKSRQEIIEDNVEVVIEQQNDILPDIIKQVQTTPLRGRTKKTIQDNLNIIIPQVEPTPVEQEKEIINKKTRGGRTKKKDEKPGDDVKPTRTTSLRNRNKKEEEFIIPKEVQVASKRTTRNKKFVEPVVNIEENPPTTKVRATPSRSKKKASLATTEPIIVISPKNLTTKSKKRKGNDETTDAPPDVIQPSSPKRRVGRNTRSKNSTPFETILIPPFIDQEPPPLLPVQQQEPLMSTRSSRRGKKDIDIPIEKQEDIVLNKKTRTGGRAKKTNEPINTDNPVSVVMTSVTTSIPTSSSMNSLVSKPPRPPIVRKKKSLAMPPLPQTSPTTPPKQTQRIQSTSPVNDEPLLPIPVPINNKRRRQPQRRIVHSPIRVEKSSLEISPSNNRNQKRTRSSVATTPKRIRREDLMITTMPSTPGKKRNKCTCQKRRNKRCDICAAAIDS